MWHRMRDRLRANVRADGSASSIRQRDDVTPADARAISVSHAARGDRSSPTDRMSHFSASFLGLLAAGFLLGALMGPTTAHAQQRDSVIIEQRVLVTPEMTNADAKRRAIEEALAEGVRRVAGVRIQSNALAIMDERGSALRGGYSSVVQLDAAARAVDYRVLDDEWITNRLPGIGAQLSYRAKVLVTVERELDAPDPGFTADVSLNATRYVARTDRATESDEILATLRLTRSAFVNVFVITDDSAERVIPNEYVRELHGAANSDVPIPPADWRARGVRLRASLPRGRESVRSLMMVVATLDEIAPPPSRVLSVLEVQRWLVRIPPSKRALAFAAFETVR